MLITVKKTTTVEKVNNANSKHRNIPNLSIQKAEIIENERI